MGRFKDLLPILFLVFACYMLFTTFDIKGPSRIHRPGFTPLSSTTPQDASSSSSTSTSTSPSFLTTDSTLSNPQESTLPNGGTRLTNPSAYGQVTGEEFSHLRTDQELMAEENSSAAADSADPEEDEEDSEKEVASPMLKPSKVPAASATPSPTPSPAAGGKKGAGKAAAAAAAKEAGSGGAAVNNPENKKVPVPKPGERKLPPIAAKVNQLLEAKERAKKAEEERKRVQAEQKKVQGGQKKVQGGQKKEKENEKLQRQKEFKEGVAKVLVAGLVKEKQRKEKEERLQAEREKLISEMVKGKAMGGSGKKTPVKTLEEMLREAEGEEEEDLELREEDEEA